MRELPKSSARVGGVVSPRRCLLGVAMMGAVGLRGPAGAQTPVPTPEADPTPTVAAPRLHFRTTVPFQAEYLTRLGEMVVERQRSAEEVRRELRVSASAAAYAKRYRISDDLAQRIIATATAEGVDPELAFRLVRVESVFKPRARGSAGALGLTQLMPSTARMIDRSVNTEAEILDPQTNLRLGFRYLRQMIERYRGDVRLGVLAYNRGEGAVDRALRRGQNPENGYSHKVLGTKSSNPYRGQGVLRKPSARSK